MLYIIQIDPEVPPGIMESELERLGVECTVIRLHDGETLPGLAAVGAVMVLGGAMGANDDEAYPFLTGLKEFIRTAVQREIPYLGICLGGQLLAAALGAKVTSNAFPEQGSSSVMLTEEGCSDRLFEGISQAFITFQWHNDSFAIPGEGVRLAFSGTCRNQAFRVGSRAWGLQFHPEVDAIIVGNWSSWTAETAARSAEIITSYREWEAEYREVARKMVENFVALTGLKK